MPPRPPPSRPSWGPQTPQEVVGCPYPCVIPILSTRAGRILGQEPCNVSRLGAQGSQAGRGPRPRCPLRSPLWPEPGRGAWRAAAGRGSDPARPFPRGGGWGSGRWRLQLGAGLWARLGPSEPTDRRRRPRRAVLCPRRNRRGWPGPAASTTLREPREERPPGPAPRSPPPVPRRGPETILPTAKRSKRDPRN